MTDDIDQLANWITPLVQQLSAPRQRRLMADIAAHMRRSQSKRIASQRNPDGSKFAARKRQRKVARPMRFVYRTSDGRVRQAQMVSYRKEGDRFIGYDTEAGGIRTFLQKRMLARLDATGASPRTRGPKAARAMFERLRTAQYMKRTSTGDSATVYIDGYAASIARVHQYGLRDKVDRKKAKSPTVKYDARQLLGFAPEDIKVIENLVIGYLATAR